MSRLVVHISQLDTTEQLTVKATCIYMNRLEQTELEVVVEMRVVQLYALDYMRLIGLMYPGFPLTQFSTSQNNPHHKLVTQGVNANTDRALSDLKTKSAGPVAIVTNITTTMHSSAGADAQAEGLGLRVLHSILSNAEFKLATKLNDDSFVVMSTDPADAAGNPLPIALSETGHPIDRSVRLDQLRCYGFEPDVTVDTDYPTSIVRAKLRRIGASGMPLPSVFLSVIRMAQTETRNPQLWVQSGGLIRNEADGSCLVNAVIALPYNLEIPFVEIPFRFSDGATGAVSPTSPTCILQEMIRWFYEQDRRTKRKLLDGRAGDELDRGVLTPLDGLSRRLSEEYYASRHARGSEAPIPARAAKRAGELDIDSGLRALRYSFYFNEKAEPNASSLGRLMDRSKYVKYDVYDFKLEAESGIPPRLEMRRADEAVDNVHSVWLDYQESANTKISLSVVVAGARNTVDVRSALSLKDGVDDAAATAAIRQKGGVMLKRAAKYNEDATKEDDRRTAGLTMQIFGTLLSFLAYIGMCDAETSVYVYPGEIIGQSKPKVDESGAPKGLDSLVEYYRRSTFEPLRGPGIMVTTVGRLIERGAPMRSAGAPVAVYEEYGENKKKKKGFGLTRMLTARLFGSAKE